LDLGIWLHGGGHAFAVDETVGDSVVLHVPQGDFVGALGWGGRSEEQKGAEAEEKKTHHTRVQEREAFVM
jgi:hypothetical protein